MQISPLDLAKSEVDPLTGLSIKGRARMSALLQISERQLDRLTRNGVLPQRPDGMYAVRESIDRHAEYLAGQAHRPSRLDRAKEKQAELLQRRLDREAAEVIGRTELRTTMGTVASAFIDSVVEVGERSGGGMDETERARRREIARLAAGQLEERMAPEIEELLTGKKRAED